MVANGKGKTIRNPVVRIGGLERLSGVMLLYPSGSERMKSDGGNAGKGKEEKRLPAKEENDGSKGADVCGPIEAHPKYLSALRNAVGVEDGTESLNDEKQCKPYRLAQGRISNETGFPLKWNVRVFVGTVELDVMKNMIVSEHHG